MTRVTIISIITTLSCLVVSCEALTAYLSYSDNSVCVDEYTIKGKAAVDYDDEDGNDYSDWSYSMNYYGGCMYYIGGSWDVDNYNWDDDFYDYGMCVECDGLVGCSSDGTCDTFMTYSPSEQKALKSSSSSSGYQMSQNGNEDNDNTGSSTTTSKTPQYGLASKAKEYSMEAQEFSSMKMSNDNNGGYDDTTRKGSKMALPSLNYYFVFGCVAMVGIFATGYMIIRTVKPCQNNVNNDEDESTLSTASSSESHPPSSSQYHLNGNGALA